MISSRSDNKSQKYFKCSCQLFIEQFKASHAGYLYFIWVSGNKQTQTLKYDATNSNVIQIGQTLILNLNLSAKNGKFIPKQTNLYLLNEEGQQLDDIEIDVSEWPQNFKQNHLPIGRGTLKAKVRRKQIMQVSSLQQSSEHTVEQNVKVSRGKVKFTQQTQTYMLKGGQKSFYIGRNQKSFVSGHMNSLSMQNANEQLIQELGKVKKQLEDNVYLNNKLKNDRDVLMKKHQQLEVEIQTILKSVNIDFRNLRQHYDKRLTIREEIYQEEIEQMIAMINGNSQYSKKVIQQLYRQKAKMEQQYTSQKVQLQTVKKELKNYKDKYQGDLQFLNDQLNKKIMQHQKQKQDELKKLQEQMQKKNQEVEAIKLQVISQKQQMEKELEVYKLEFQKSRVNNLSLEDQLNEQVKKLQQKSVQVQQKVQQIQKATMNIRTLSQMLQAQQKMIAQMKGQLQILRNKQKNSSQQILNLNAALLQKDERLKQIQAQLEEITYQLQFNQDAHKQLKVQHEQKQQQLYNQLENIQAIYNDKMEQYAKKLHEKLEELNKQNNQLRQKLGLSQKHLSKIQSQLMEKQSQIQMVRQSQKQALQNGQKYEHVKKIQSQKERIRNQFQQKLRELQIALLKKDQELSERIRQLEDELHITRKKKDESQIKLKHYQKEFQNLKDGRQTHMPQVHNQSIQMSRSLQASKQDSKEITLGPSNPHYKDYEDLIYKKEQQIHRLNNRIQQLNNWCGSLQTKLREAHSMKLIQYCDSEKNQEDEINKNEVKKRVILDDLQALQRSKHKPNSNGRTNNHVHLDRTGPNAVANKQMILDEANFGYTPKNASYLKRRQSMGMSKDLSEHSNTSYIRVSHNQKIKEQEDLIKQFEQREQKYKKQIEEHLKKIQNLTGETQKIKNELGQYMNKPHINESTLNQMEALRSLSISQKQELQKRTNQLDAIKEQLRLSRQQISKIRPQLDHLKTLKPQMQNEIKQISKLNAQLKQNLIQIQIRLKDSQRRLVQSQEFNKKASSQSQNLSKIIAQLEQKIRQNKEHQQQLKMQSRQLMFINQQTTNQMKRYKSLYEQLQQKIKKYAGSDVTIKQLQKQVEEWNKRNLEQVRLFNHLKLEKDSIQQEMKLIKKRHGQQTRIAIQWEQKAAGLQRVIDQYKRKQAKFKRQIEQAQQQVRKNRSQTKKIEEQLHTLQTLSTSFNYQKKKFMDELAQKCDQVTRKQYENNRLLKELQKYRHKIQQSQDNRLGRKNQLRYEIQKLESQVIKKDKRILQMEEQLKILKGRLQFLQKQNGKIMQKKTQTYGDKLKHYIDQIASIKKLLDEYQSENTRLKLQNNQFFEENELLKLSFSKLQKKYEQNIDNQENILTDLQHYMDQVNLLSEKNRQYELQLDRVEQSYIQTKKQLDQQKNHHKKKSERLQSSQKTNGLLMEEVKQLKIKLSQLQTQTKINYNINQKYRNLDRKKNQIQQQLKKIKHDYQTYKSIFVYKQEQVQKLCQQIRNHQRKQKEQQLNAAIDQITKSNNLKINKFEAQLLQMFNQNSKLRQELVSKAEQLGKTKLQITDLESMIQKVLIFQNQIKQLNQQINFYKEQIKRKNDKISKDQIYIKELQTKIETQQVELKDSISRINELQMKIQKLNNKIAVLQQNQEGLQDKIRELIQKQKEIAQQKIIQQQTSQTNPNSKQNLQRKLFQLQLELAKSKERQNSLTVEYNTKIKSLQSKLQQMSQTMAEHTKTMQKNYQDELYKSEQSILKLSEQLQDKLIRIDELNEAIIVLQQQNQEMAKQLNTTRYKLDQQTEIFNIQYGKIKQKLKESQQIYNQNLKSLQDELTAMGKELTIAKYNRGNGEAMSGSRLNNSQIQDAKKTAKRMEEKLKAKDKKIDQLKSNIYILQETILKLRKKESSSETISSEYQNLKSDYNRLQMELKNQTKRFQSETKSMDDLIKQLKQQILTAKQNQQNAKIALQQKSMEFISMQSQLKTMRQLYAQLQKEIDRRKMNLTNQIQGESQLVLQLRNKQSIINDYRQKIQELNMSLNTYISQNKKLSHELKTQTSSNKQQTLRLQNLSKQAQQMQNIKLLTKKELEELRDKNHMIEGQIKSLRSQLQKVKKFYEETKSQLAVAYQEIQKYSKGSDFMEGKVKQYEHIVTKYKRIDQICLKQIGASLEQLIQDGYFVQTLEQKQNQINQLIQQVQQLKFLSDRKLLDYDQLKKQNYQLTLKAEDNQILAEQVQNLRRICDKLQEQKKQAVFKEQLIKMHLGNLIESNDEQDQYKRKLQQILRSVASMNQLGAISFGQSSFGNY